MRVLRNQDVTFILRNLSKTELLSILHSFSRTLREFSIPSSSPPQIHQPLRTAITTSLGHTSLFMPSSNTHTTGIKVVSIPAKGSGLPSALNIFTPDGRLAGILNSAEITGFRTALASMVIFSNREWQGPGEIVIFGAGKQAEWHLRLALLLAKPEITRVTIVNRSQGSLDVFERNVLADLRSNYFSVDFDTLVSSAHAYSEEQLRPRLETAVAVFCCTPSTEVLFPYEYWASSPARKRYLSLIGSYKPHMHEVDSKTVRSGELLCVDDKKACLEESGELIGAEIKEEELIELGELISKGSGELTDASEHQLEVLSTGNVIFKCVGIGIMDIVVGKILLDIAEDRGSGIVVDDF